MLLIFLGANIRVPKRTAITEWNIICLARDRDHRSQILPEVPRYFVLE